MRVVMENSEGRTMRVAVICAFDPNRNCGIYIVLKESQFFSQFPEIEPVFLTLGDADRLDSGDEALDREYRELQSDPDFPAAYDAIYYWGDFLHARGYWSADLIPRLLSHKVVGTRDEATELIYKLVLLEDQPDEILRRVVIFGGTTIADGVEAIEDQRYEKALTRLFSLCAAAKMRDAVSAFRIAQMTGKTATAGLDAAYLFTWANEWRGEPGAGKIGFYFGRSHRREKYLFVLLMLWLRVAKKWNVSWIQWFPAKRNETLFRMLSVRKHDARTRPVAEIVDDLTECEICITDVYHVCVNAWSAGIPAVCFGYGAKYDSDTVGSKKKEVMYLNMFAHRWYLFWENLSLTRLRQVSNLIVDLREQRERARQVFQYQSAVSKRVHDELAAVTREMIAKSAQ